MNIYLTDSQGFFTGEIQQIVDPFLPLPQGIVKPPPPLVGSEVACWVGNSWAVFPVRPQMAANVPPEVTMRQARLALLQFGLLDQIEGAINSLPSPEKEKARIEWEYSGTVQRHNGFVARLSPLLGLTDAGIDNLFVAAGGFA